MNSPLVISDPDSDINQEYQEEAQSLLDVVHSIITYPRYALNTLVKRKRNDLLRVPPRHKQLLGPQAFQRLDQIQHAIETNQIFLRAVIQATHQEDWIKSLFSRIPKSEEIVPKSTDLDKVISTLKQIARDWSELGQSERDQCYQPILTVLDELFPNASDRYKSVYSLRLLSLFSKTEKQYLLTQE